MKRAIAILAGTAVGALLLWAASAVANHVGGEPNEDEVKCQVKAGKVYPKFVAKMALAVIKCEKGERAGTNPSTDCEAPYSGATEAKVIELKAAATAKAGDCADCPECYDAGGNCAAWASAKTPTIEAQVNGFHDFVWCVEMGGDGLNPDEAKCQDAVAKWLAKGVKKIGKIESSCIKKEHRGDVGMGNCAPGSGSAPDPLSVADPDTQAKFEAVLAKTTQKIKDNCQNIDNPECYSPNFDDAEEWVAFTESTVAGNYTAFYCDN